MDSVHNGKGSSEDDEIVSEAFPPPGENDNPFRVPSWHVSQGSSNDANTASKPVVTLFLKPIDKANSRAGGVIFDEVASKAEQAQKKKKPKYRKDKPFKVLRSGRSRSSASSNELIDPEEEKLKLLPDCCEFTVRRNEAFEVDEGRKEMSSVWFSQVKLAPAQQKQLCFSESLLTVEESGSVVGKFCGKVTNSKWNAKPCLCVHTGSFGKFSTGLESGTSITSFISYNLKPLQEFVHEWATINSDTIERKTFITKEMDTLSCKITLIRNRQVVDNKSFNLKFRERNNLVTEGINVLLQRLLILEKRTLGSMTVQSISFTGKVVMAKYSELGSGWENVKGKQMKTWGIRRTVNVSDNEERTWDSLYNKNSRLVLRCQPDSPQALIPFWFESIIDFDKHGHFIGSYSPYAWACDVELYSKYAVKKEEFTYEHRRYILDHPEVRALLSDYLQSILFRKPQNVVDFTKQYFESFIHLRAKSSKPQKKATDTSSRTSSYYYDGSHGSRSSISLFGEEDLDLGEGEWLGEDGDAASFYPANPTVNYDGLEKVEDPSPNTATESEIFTTENETDDDLVVNERGQYIRSVK